MPNLNFFKNLFFNDTAPFEKALVAIKNDDVKNLKEILDVNPSLVISVNKIKNNNESLKTTLIEEVIKTKNESILDVILTTLSNYQPNEKKREKFFNIKHNKDYSGVAIMSLDNINFFTKLVVAGAKLNHIPYFDTVTRSGTKYQGEVTITMNFPGQKDIVINTESRKCLDIYPILLEKRSLDVFLNDNKIQETPKPKTKNKI